MSELRHLSYSSVNTYLLCGHAWRLHYLEKKRYPVAPALPFGSAFHKTVQQYIEQKAHDGLKDMALDLGGSTEGDLTSHDIIAQIWHNKWAVQCKQRIDWESGADTPTTMGALGAKMLAAPRILSVIDEIAAGYGGPNCYMERRIELHIEGVPIPIIGYIDIMPNDGIPIDLKTAGRMWQAGKAQKETQPLFYIAGLSQMGQPVPGNAFRYAIFTKSPKNPYGKMFECQYAFADLFWLYDLIKGVWRGIDAEVFPMNPTGWKCSPKYCQFWGECRGKYG